MQVTGTDIVSAGQNKTFNCYAISLLKHAQAVGEKVHHTLTYILSCLPSGIISGICVVDFITRLLAIVFGSLQHKRNAVSMLLKAAAFV
jgi:hypothetical protein